MWNDLREEVGEMFTLLEGCGLPDGDRENCGFSVWDPEKKNEEQKEYLKSTFGAVRRKAYRQSAAGKASERASAKRYREANRETLNDKRRLKRAQLRNEKAK